eukprot:g1999.t1
MASGTAGNQSHTDDLLERVNALVGSPPQNQELPPSSLLASPADVALRAADPVLGRLDGLVDKFGPGSLAVAHRISDALAALRKLPLPRESRDLLAGITMVFFGGSFQALIAASEAFYMGGGDKVHRCTASLQRIGHKLLEQSRADDAVDADGDGVADVRQMPPSQLLRRKLALAAHELDPREVGDALHGLYTGGVLVMATMRSRFAQSITLGNGLGLSLHNHLRRRVAPLVLRAPAARQPWIEAGTRYACKSLGMLVAWAVQRVVSAFHSATSGAQLLTRALLELLVRKKLFLAQLDRDHDGHPDIEPGTPTFNRIATCLAALGLFVQLRWRFQVPFPLSVLLKPAIAAEWALTYTLASGAQSARKGAPAVPVAALAQSK